MRSNTRIGECEMKDTYVESLYSLRGILKAQADSYIEQVRENRRQDEKFPRIFSASYLEAERRTLKAALARVGEVTVELNKIIMEVENEQAQSPQALGRG